jgi:hypothetical protein
MFVLGRVFLDNKDGERGARTGFLVGPIYLKSSNNNTNHTHRRAFPESYSTMTTHIYHNVPYHTMIYSMKQMLKTL